MFLSGGNPISDSIETVEEDVFWERMKSLNNEAEDRKEEIKNYLLKTVGNTVTIGDYVFEIN